MTVAHNLVPKTKSDSILMKLGAMINLITFFLIMQIKFVKQNTNFWQILSQKLKVFHLVQLNFHNTLRITHVKQLKFSRILAKISKTKNSGMYHSHLERTSHKSLLGLIFVRNYFGKWALWKLFSWQFILKKWTLIFINQSIIFANQKINNIYTSLYNLLGMQFCKTIKRIWLGLLIGSKNQLSSKKKGFIV